MISNKPTYTYFENEDIQPVLQAATNTLLLNSSFVDNPGLLHGKMGISICFFHLARQTGNPIYEAYAGELIDEIYDKITADTPVDATIRHGISGIAWIYMQLHRLEGGNHFNDDMGYWIDKLLLHKDRESLLTRHFNEGGNIFGVLEGLAGIMLLTKSLKKEALKQ